MNKRVFFLISLLLILLLAVSSKFYLNAKKEFLDEYIHYIAIKKRIKDINFLKDKYKRDLVKLKHLKRFCNITSADVYKLRCDDLNEKEFSYVQNMLFRSNFKFKKFDIRKEKNIFIYAEIYK